MITFFKKLHVNFLFAENSLYLRRILGLRRKVREKAVAFGAMGSSPGIRTKTE